MQIGEEGFAHFKERNQQLQAHVFTEEPVSLEGIPDRLDQFLLGEGFDHKSLGSEFHRLNGIVDRAVTRHHHGRNFFLVVLDGLKEFEAVHPGHTDVGQQEVEVLESRQFDGRFGAGRSEGLIGLALENFRTQPPDMFLIINDQDALAHASFTLSCLKVSGGPDDYCFKQEAITSLPMDGPGVLLKADACIITAIIVIQIVDKRSLHAVPENDPDKTEPPRHGGRTLFGHDTDSPLGIPEMNHLVTQFQEQSLHSIHPCRPCSRRFDDEKIFQRKTDQSIENGLFFVKEKSK